MKIVRIGRVMLACDVAATKATREEGLRPRSSLRPSEGMLFVFDERQSLVEMTMAGVRFPLDMVFVDRGRIVRIDENVQPETHVIRGKNVTEVIEAPAGFCKAHRIDLEDRVEYLGGD